MGILEIVLLVIGLVIFTLSFIIPEKKESISKEENKIAEKLVRELVGDQLSLVSLQMENIFDEKNEENMERLERRMERLSNEKILAVGEYSDTVLGDIKKSHDEVVFLYDMLNAKHKSLNELLDKVDHAKAEWNKQIDTSEHPENEEKKLVTENEPGFKPLQPKIAEVKKPQSQVRRTAVKATDKVGSRESGRTSKKLTNKVTGQGNVAIQFSKNSTMGQNSNERILKLHKEGKSNMVIAKELGLGIGEVKLVIDLFKGI